MIDLGSFGKFPWQDLLIQTLGIATAYFTGRYRSTTVNKTRRKGD